MRKFSLVLILLIPMVILQGCAVAALVGAAGYTDKQNKAAKRDFQYLNLERQKAGLEPLTWDEYKHGDDVNKDDDTKDTTDSNDTD